VGRFGGLAPLQALDRVLSTKNVHNELHMKTHTQGPKVPVCVVSLSKLLGCSWGFGGGAPQQAGEMCCRHIHKLVHNNERAVM
jgi:hypothetical protein